MQYNTHLSPTFNSQVQFLLNFIFSIILLFSLNVGTSLKSACTGDVDLNGGNIINVDEILYASTGIVITDIAGDDIINSTELSSVVVRGTAFGFAGQTISVSTGLTTQSIQVGSNSYWVATFNIGTTNLALATNNIATITTTVTSWNTGTTAEQLGRMVDGSTSTSGTNDYAVHPKLAKGKTITFSFSSQAKEGSFIFYNRVGCCQSRIDDSTVEFYSGSTLVQTFTFSNSGNTPTFTLSDPDSSFDEVVLTFDPNEDSHNFREIEIFGYLSTATFSAEGTDSNNVLYSDNRTAQIQ